MTTLKDLKVGQKVRITDTFNNPQGTRYRMTVTEGTVRHVGLNGSQHRAVVDGLTVQERRDHEVVIEILKDVKPELSQGYYLVRNNGSTPVVRYVCDDGCVRTSPIGVVAFSIGDYPGYTFERIHTYDPKTQVVVKKSDLPSGLLLPSWGQSRHERIDRWNFTEANYPRNVALRALANALDKQEEEGK